MPESTVYTVLFLKGVLIGFSIAMPVGPIGILCIQHTLTRGRLQGFVAGLGAALADTIYGALAVFGITVVGDFFIAYQLVIKILAAAFLYFLGFRMIYAKTEAIQLNYTQTTLFKAFSSTFFLTLANPFTILAFGAVYAAFGLGLESVGTCPSCAILGGIIVGSATWWFLLSFGAAFIGARFFKTETRILSRISGSILLVFALFTTFVALQDILGTPLQLNFSSFLGEF